MKPNDHFYRYLEHIQHSVPMSEFIKENVVNAVALRHDIDHDLDIALDFAYWEHQRELRSTFYVLHDHEYNEDPHFWDKLLQIQDYGHEVGVHLNLIAGWVKGKYENPIEHLTDWLSTAKRVGVKITGSATHGDPECYNHNFLNSWLFQERKAATIGKMNLSAEGIADPRSDFQISPPRDDMIVRDDGARLRLWSESALKLGISHEAIEADGKYWSDTGKEWLRTGDPLTGDLTKGRHQILMHPIHWLSEPRKIFFLSTARVGSKWLAKAVEQCTSAKVAHEWTLNHRQRDGQVVLEKMATLDNEGLKEKPKYAQKLIDYSARYNQGAKRDRVEFNVYLADYVQEVKRSFANAELYGVVRDGHNVIPSLLSRDWYGAENSVRHPNNKRYARQSLSQFEKCCKYWAETNEIIYGDAIHMFKIEDLTRTQTSLSELLRQLDFPVHERLLNMIDLSPRDKTKPAELQDARFWTQPHQSTFNEICNQLQARFGYSTRFPVDISVLWHRSKLKISSIIKQQTPIPDPQVSALKFTLKDLSFHGVNASTALKGNQLMIEVLDHSKPAYVMLPGSSNSRWTKQDIKSGIATQIENGTVNTTIKFNVETTLNVRLYYLEHNDDDGSIYRKQLLTLLRTGWRGLSSERIQPCGRLSSFGIYIEPVESNDRPQSFMINSLEVEVYASPNDYLFSDQH